MASANGVINIALRRVGASRVSNWATGTDKEDILARDIYHEARRDVLGLHTWNHATRRVKLTKLTSAPGFGWDNAFAMPDDFIRVVSVHPADAEHATIPYKLEHIDDTSTSGTITVVTAADTATDTYQFKGINLVDTTLTEGTDWDRTNADNNATATSLATAISVINGLTATASSAVITIASDNGFTLQSITLSDSTATTRTQPTVKPQYSLFSNSDTIYLRYVFDLDDMNIWSANMRDVLALRLARDFALPLTQDRLLAEKLDLLYEKKLSRSKSVDGVEDWPERQPAGSWFDSRMGGRDFIINDG